MRKRTLSLLLLFSYASLLPGLAQDSGTAAVSSVERIQQIAAELNQISQERESYLTELENMNEERKKEIEERLIELQQRENELKELKQQLELFGNLIDDQARYYKNLNRKLTFWRIISGVLATSLITTFIIYRVSK